VTETDATASSELDLPLAPGAPSPATPGRYDRSIIEGPLRSAVWKIAWPTMLMNIIGGLQGIIDHVLVGHFVGYAGNAAIGVAWQIIIVVIVFITSLFTGMSVLVARFAGAGEEGKVDRTVYQAFLTALGMSLLVMAPLGYFLSPALLDLVNAAPAVKAQALPFLRIMFLFSTGMLLFYMLGGALRSAGDARTPMILGIAMTVLNIVFNVILIPGLGPIPAFGTTGSAMGTVLASGLVSAYALYKFWRGGWVVSFPHGGGYGPDWAIIRALFRFGLPTGIQGIAMNIGGVFMLAFIGSLAQSAAAQAAFAVSYTQLFSLITWTSVGLMGAAAAVAGQNLGAGKPDRATEAVHVAARIGMMGAALVGMFFLLLPRQLLAVFGMDEPNVVEIGTQLLRILSVSGVFIAVALTYTGGLQGTGDTRSPLYISIVSQVLVPLGICYAIQQTGTLEALHIWVAILIGHATRCALSVARFNQGNWRRIAVDLDKAAVVVLIGLAAASAASAQTGSARSVIEGRVVGPTGTPIEDVEVLWQQGKRSVLTRADGGFNLVIPARGEVIVLVRRLGFNAQALRVDLTRSTLWRGEIVLQQGSFRLPDVEVTARYAKPAAYAGTAKFDDFFRRQRLGVGTYISREQIERSNAFHTIEILRGIPGVRADIHPVITDQAVSFARCSQRDPDYNVTVWIDGQRIYPEGGSVASPKAVAEMIARISPTGIEMIEIYRGASQIPAEYHTDGCAAMVIWTRHNRV